MFEDIPGIFQELPAFCADIPPCKVRFPDPSGRTSRQGFHNGFALLHLAVEPPLLHRVQAVLAMFQRLLYPVLPRALNQGRCFK